MSEKELQLPELRVADLEEAGIDKLFEDLSSAAELLEVVVKAGATTRCAGTVRSLDAARDALRSEDVRGVQLRYRFDGRVWCDTLMRAGRGARLVRSELLLAPGHHEARK